MTRRGEEGGINAAHAAAHTRLSLAIYKVHAWRTPARASAVAKVAR